MDLDSFNLANKLMDERKKISRELDVWEKELTRTEKIGYLQGWNNNHPVELKSNISKELFDSFRRSAINELELRIINIDNEFSKL